MLKDWPGCFDNLLRVWNVSHGRHPLVSSWGFLLRSMVVLASLPHLQKVMNLGHSLQCPFLRLFLHFRVVFSVHCIQFWVSTCQIPIVSSSNLPYNESFAKGLACGFWLPPAVYISAKVKTGLHSDTTSYDREYVLCHIAVIGILWLCFLLLTPPVGNVRYPKCTANLHWVVVGIIEIWNDLPPVHWSFRQRIQIAPGGSQ